MLWRMPQVMQGATKLNPMLNWALFATAPVEKG